MGAPATTQEITLGERRIEAYAARLGPKAFTALFAGALLVALCALKPAWRERLEASYLVAFCFFLSITLGALFFVVIQHLVKAGWSVVVRRVAEGLSLNVGLCLVLFLPLLGMTGALYPWAHWAHGDHAPAAHHAPPTPGVGPGVEAAPAVLTRSSPDGTSTQAELVHPHPSPSKHT